MKNLRNCQIFSTVKSSSAWHPILKNILVRNFFIIDRIVCNDHFQVRVYLSDRLYKILNKKYFFTSCSPFYKNTRIHTPKILQADFFAIIFYERNKNNVKNNKIFKNNLLPRVYMRTNVPHFQNASKKLFAIDSG